LPTGTGNQFGSEREQPIGRLDRALDALGAPRG
jgi:hypothetical protein